MAAPAARSRRLAAVGADRAGRRIRSFRVRQGLRSGDAAFWAAGGGAAGGAGGGAPVLWRHDAGLAAPGPDGVRGQGDAQGHAFPGAPARGGRRLASVTGHAGTWSVPLEIGSGEASMLGPNASETIVLEYVTDCRN